MNWNGLELPNKPYFQDDEVVIYHADCRDILPLLSGIDAVVTDPPYGLGFMNKEWDNPQKERELIERERKRSEQRFREGKSPTTAPFSQSVRPGLAIKGAKEGRWFQEWCFQWAEMLLNAMKPGGHLLSFGATRQYHRMACAIEDAGFEIRDMVEWMYGSGFPKSHNVGLSVDKLMGHPDRGHRIAVASRHHPDGTLEPNGELLPPYEAKSDEAKQWEGWGTALKPAHEPICLARKPLSEKTVAENVLKWGTGAINIDSSRIPLNGDKPQAGKRTATFGTQETQSGGDGSGGWGMDKQGRFPANLIHDGSQEVMELFPPSAGAFAPVSRGKSGKSKGIYGDFAQKGDDGKTFHGDGLGSAARFFYCAKASRAERDAGLEDVEPQRIEGRDEGQDERNVPYKNRPAPQRNQHPTVKPLALMRYLINLITPPNGIVLDPFMGSGSTLLAAKGYKAIGIEIEEKYCEIAAKRCSQKRDEVR